MKEAKTLELRFSNAEPLELLYADIDDILFNGTNADPDELRYVPEALRYANSFHRIQVITIIILPTDYIYIEGRNLEKLYASLLQKSVCLIAELPPALDMPEASEPAVHRINPLNEPLPGFTGPFSRVIG